VYISCCVWADADWKKYFARSRQVLLSVAVESSLFLGRRLDRRVENNNWPFFLLLRGPSLLLSRAQAPRSLLGRLIIGTHSITWPVSLLCILGDLFLFLFFRPWGRRFNKRIFTPCVTSFGQRSESLLIVWIVRSGRLLFESPRKSGRRFVNSKHNCWKKKTFFPTPPFLVVIF
jgi:hypothetical protein